MQRAPLNALNGQAPHSTAPDVKPDPDAVKLEPGAAEPEPAVVKPEPVAVKPEPAVVTLPVLGLLPVLGHVHAAKAWDATRCTGIRGHEGHAGSIAGLLKSVALAED